MTTTAIETRNTSTRRPARPPRHAGRIATVITLVISLAASAILRQVAADRQTVINNVRGSAASRSTLGNMDSFALALLLGGLRGPLVMFLWPAIENQKADHDLEDIDTMIEWVRLLQPEFDSVHMFQIWNKAYNISAMMASPANKYTVIMEALDYAHSVDLDRPGDINILSATSNVYSGKFGATNLPEYPFYSHQFREESLTDANRIAAYPDDQSSYVRLDKWQPLLDEKNQVRADLVAPVHSRPPEIVPTSRASDDMDDAASPAVVVEESEWNDGSELQYLKKLGPFPYGIGPRAMAYNYAKRAEVALSVEQQKPLQYTPMVIDSQPAIELKFWVEDDVRRARFYEAKAVGISTTTWNPGIDNQLAEIPPRLRPNTDRKAIDAALYYYANANQVSREAMKEYGRHLRKPEYAMRKMNPYGSHRKDMEIAGEMNPGDHDYLAATITADPAERKRLLLSARDHYSKADLLAMRTVLQFFTEIEILWPKGMMIAGSVMPTTNPTDFQNMSRVFTLTDAEVPKVYRNAMKLALNRPSEHQTDRESYNLTVFRCENRLAAISPEVGK